jgi:hypothetical protein
MVRVHALVHPRPELYIILSGHLSGVYAFNVICNVTLSSPYLSASFHPPNLSFSGIRKVKKFKQCLLEKLA